MCIELVKQQESSQANHQNILQHNQGQKRKSSKALTENARVGSMNKTTKCTAGFPRLHMRHYSYEQYLRVELAEDATRRPQDQQDSADAAINCLLSIGLPCTVLPPSQQLIFFTSSFFLLNIYEGP